MNECLVLAIGHDNLRDSELVSSMTLIQIKVVCDDINFKYILVAVLS